jgi:hypothetical protein
LCGGKFCEFFVCVLSCFFGLGLGLVATGLPKHLKTYQKVAEEEAFRSVVQVVYSAFLAAEFFACVLGCFSYLGLGLSAGCVEKSQGKSK